MKIMTDNIWWIRSFFFSVKK